MAKTNSKHIEQSNDQVFYVGIDVHKKSWSISVRSLNMQVAQFSQPPSALVLYNTLFEKFPDGKFYSAYEAGFCGTSIHEDLIKLGLNNIIINAADIPKTDKQQKNKTDLHDCHAIAKYLEKGMLHSIHIFPRQHQELRALFRLRMKKVSDTTRAINRLKGHLYFFGIQIPLISLKGSITLKVIKWLESLQLPTASGEICLKKYIADLKYQRQELLEITKLLRNEISVGYSEQFDCLLSVPGIGPVTAMALLAEIGDFSRFKNPDEFCSFLGLAPWEYSSGDNIRTNGMQPRCNTYLRPLIVEASWISIRRSPALLLYYRKHAAKGNKHAIIKVARKLALIVKAVAQKMQPFREEQLLAVN